MPTDKRNGFNYPENGTPYLFVTRLIFVVGDILQRFPHIFNKLLTILHSHL